MLRPIVPIGRKQLATELDDVQAEAVLTFLNHIESKRRLNSVTEPVLANSNHRAQLDEGTEIRNPSSGASHGRGPVAFFKFTVARSPSPRNVMPSSVERNSVRRSYPNRFWIGVPGTCDLA
jgi:hypothetical protein